jgi:hypothetical protein
MLQPIALAVRTLRVRRNAVGCSIGSSAGFATLQDAVDEIGHAPQDVDFLDAKREQCAGAGEIGKV